MRSGKQRLYILVLAGILLIAGTLAYIRYFATFRFWLPPPVGDGAAGPSVAREPFEHPWTTGNVVLLGIGDSVTAGFGASPGHSYFEMLFANPEDEYPEMRGVCLRSVLPNLKPMNISVSGSDSIQHRNEQVGELKPFPEAELGIVVMTSGGNDLIHWYGRGSPKEGAMYGADFAQAQPWIENYRTRLNEMLDRITSAFPGGCHIFLANIYDPSDGVGNPAAAGLPPWPDMLRIHDAYNGVIADAAEARDNVHLVDIRAAFLGHGVHCVQWWRPHYRKDDPHYWYFTNLEDPNDRGYDALRRLFLNEIEKVVRKQFDEQLSSGQIRRWRVARK
ncbi:MAG: SGNH/GDSL hydrolase family protein [Candidatus Hydrogenedentes bacterium]|nr:SGNH/GDSL hydrolase family protein [Candidatus Hydrogenedentota bacterium]